MTFLLLLLALNRFAVAVLAAVLPAAWVLLLFGLGVDGNDEREGPKLLFLFAICMAIPLLIWALVRTTGHVAGTRQRWRSLAWAVRAVGLGLPVFGYLDAVLNTTHAVHGQPQHSSASDLRHPSADR